MKNRFIKLPVYFMDMEENTECGECIEKAENMGVDKVKMCPDCFASEDTPTPNGYEWVNVDLIKTFNVMDENSVRIVFMDGDAFQYVLTEEEFLDKLGKFAEFSV
jgi:hypothetical protein